MCEFCLKHGEGEKWYLNAKNYSEDLLSDVRRRQFLQGFVSDPDHLRQEVSGLGDIHKAPRLLQGLISRNITRKMKKVHFGQVVPLEDIRKIFGFVNSIVRVACICRSITTHKEKRYCYGVSLGPNGGKLAEIFQGVDHSFLSGPEAAANEVLTSEEALEAFQGHEKEGLCHSVWTFHTPFIGGICNCDRSDCLAMKSTVTHGVKVMFRGEYVAQTDPDKCIGCRECMRVCQFGAVAYSAGEKKARIDSRYCYGVSLGPNGGKLAEIFKGVDHSYLSGPESAANEVLTSEQALEAFQAHEKEGLCHSVWTFHTPFIGGICNCDRSDCLAMRSTVTHGVKVMFRGEYVAQTDPDKCIGCRECMRVCQFGAVAYSAGEKKAHIDSRYCYGCGVCRAACKQEAIRLWDRAAVPAAASLW